jgi:DNA-binding beta-propeller fold protein YncE
MKLLRAVQFASLLFATFVNLAAFGFAQSIPAPPLAASSAAVIADLPVVAQPIRAFPALNLGGGLNVAYLGMFTPDALFRAPSKGAGSRGRPLEETILPASSSQEIQRRGDVPASMLISAERIIEDFEPPAHAMAAAHGNTRLGEARNRFLTYAYGHPSVLYAPRHVVTDSQQRLIVSDPAGNALHVLDPKGKASFRIVCGKDRRLREPSAVAVDADDNIYIADAERGLVVVFDRNGGFLRYIGNFRGEPQYARPTGMAIDREAHRIYLADTPRNLIFVLDLDGRVIKRLGRARDGSGYGEFDEPTEIAVNHEHVFVLDARGTRVHVMNRGGNLLGSFPVPHGPDPNVNRENGLGTDRNGNVYVSSFHSSVIRVFRMDGKQLSSFGQPGHSAGEFVCPRGLWIDRDNRLYVADSGNGRVQLFQLKTADHASPPERAAEAPSELHSGATDDKPALAEQ